MRAPRPAAFQRLVYSHSGAHEAKISEGAGARASSSSGSSRPGASEAVNEELSPALVKFMQTGFLRATNELVAAVMDSTWQKHGRRAAQVAAVAEFEAMLVKEGKLQSSGNIGTDRTTTSPGGHSAITYHVMTQLYADPDALHVILDEVLRARLRSMIAATSDLRHREALADATRRSDEMAELLKEGPGSLAGTLVQLLPKWALGPFAPKGNSK